MSRRSRAREIVLQVLFQEDLNPGVDRATRQLFIARRLGGDRQLIDFANNLLDGLEQKREEIDQRLKSTAENWKLSRMAVTDRNVMRLGAYEILYSETPDRVAINEAINLAKRYGSNNSFQFVNGVLDRLMKSSRSTPAESGSPPPSDEVENGISNDETQ
ncbi:MAG: transcription antitermination factor NusB [Planctomycetota bacterium]